MAAAMKRKTALSLWFDRLTTNGHDPVAEQYPDEQGGEDGGQPTQAVRKPNRRGADPGGE
jgi:hypothetical protein